MMAAGQQSDPRAMMRLLEGLVSPDSLAHAALQDWVPTGLGLDSRRVPEGGLFLACRGQHGHGLDYLDEAVARGAGALAWEPGPEIAVPETAIPEIAVPELSRHASTIADRFFGQPSARLPVVGITGTNGKSSVAHLIAHALESAGNPAGLMGTLGAGRPGALEETALTTLDAVAVQSWLARLEESGARRVAMEVSSHALVQHRVSGVRFTGAVFTNLSHDHLDYHGTLDHYARAKSRLFAHPELQWAVLNSADPEAGRMAAQLPAGARCIRYGPDSGEVALEARTEADGLDIRITGTLGEARIRSTWLGRFNAANLVAAYCVLRLFEYEPGQAARWLAEVPPVPGRMEAFGGAGQPRLVVDYAHTPDALEQVLAALREHAPGRVWCLFGCGGERDTAKRPRMGQVAARGADRVVVTDDNPRGEPGEQIVADILRGSGTRVGVTRDREQAIREAWQAAAPGDVILVAGKGHESSQEIAGEKHPFSDRELARLLVEEAE